MHRILILSDVHANLEALAACLEAAPSCDQVWNLGDLVGYGAAPNEVIAMCRKAGHSYVRGNHDKVCSGLIEPLDFNPAAVMSALWTREVLSNDHLEWLRALPAGPLDCDGLHAQMAHGSPLDEDHYLIDIVDGCQTLAESNAPLTFFGHTHVQGGFGDDKGNCFRIMPDYVNEKESETWVMKLNAGAAYLINPGSIGQPRDGDSRAAFCVWEPAKHAITYFRVPYNVTTAQERIRSAGLPGWLADRLELGR